MSFLDALDEPLETTAVPRIGAFQPKIKPRGKKPNAAGKTKVNVVDKKNAKQQPAKVALPETKPLFKTNCFSPAQDNVEIQVTLPIPSAGSPVDVKLDVGAPKTFAISDLIEEKPVLPTLVSESVGTLAVSSSTTKAIEEAPYSVEAPYSSPSESKLTVEISVEKPVGTEIITNLIPSVSYPVEENPGLVPSVQEPVGAEIFASCSPPVSQSVEESSLKVPLVQKTVSAEVIPALSPSIEELPLLNPSELASSVQKIAIEKALCLIPSKPEPLRTQSIPSSRLPVENPVEEVQFLDYSLQDPSDTQTIPLSPSRNKSPQSKKSLAMLAETAMGVVDQANDESHASQDAPDYSSPSGSVREEEKPLAELRKSKRKSVQAAAMLHCFVREVGESREEAADTNVSTSSNKRCKVRDQQSQNGVSEPGTKHKDSNESRTVASDSIDVPGNTTGNEENHSLLNAGDIVKETDIITNQENQNNDNSRCRREKMLARKPSNDFITVQGIVPDNRENVPVSNTNIPPEEGASPSNLYDKTNDQRRGWRQKLKGNAVDSSEMMQTEGLEDRENVLVSNTNSLPDEDVALETRSDEKLNKHSKHQGMKMKARKPADGSAILQQEVLVENPPNEFAQGNDPVVQHSNKSKQQRQKIKGKKAVPDSIKMSQEVLEIEKCSDPNAETPLVSIVKFATGNDQDDQYNDKSKQQRLKMKSKKAARGSAKKIQKTPTENVLVLNTNSLPDEDVALENRSDDRLNKQSKHQGMKMKARKPADGSAILQQEFLVENPPNEFAQGNDPVVRHSNKSKPQRQKIKGKKAVPDSIKMPQEVLETEKCFDPNAETALVSVVKFATGNDQDGSAILQQEVLVENPPPNEFAQGNDPVVQHGNKSKQQRQNFKGKKAVPDSIKMSQEVLETEKCFDPNAETALVSVVKFATGNDQDDQNNDKTKHQRLKMKGKAARDSAKKIQETPTEALVLSNMETGENCFDSNVEVQINDLPEKNNSQDGSAILQQEVLGENPPNEFATGNDAVDQHNNKLKRQRQKIKRKKAVPDLTKIPQDILETENCFEQNAETPLASVVEFATGNDQDDQRNDKSKRRRSKMKGKIAAHGSVKMIQETPSEVLVPSKVETGENCFDSKVEVQLNDLPDKNSQDGSAILQQEVLVENPPNEFATGNDVVDQQYNKSKQQRRKCNGKKAVPDSKKMSQKETENILDPNAESPLASVVEFATGNDQDDQIKDISKQQRPKMKAKNAACGSTRTLQKTPTEMLVPSNVETGENIFDSNMDVQLNDLPEKKNSQSMHRKRKPIPLAKDFDHNDLYTGTCTLVQPSEDQELNENVTEKQTRKKRRASTSKKSLESSKQKFSHSTVRRRRRVEQQLLDTPEVDLDTSKLTLTALIRLAEAKERNQKKEELTKNKLQSTKAASNSNANKPSKEPEEEEGDILAPQVILVNGQIVINEESLVVSHRDLNSDDFRTYRRVEESTSKLNYHTYMNRTPAERWSKSDTELFYKAMQQFGTDFAMIQHFFPGRTRRQVKAKFKTEERKNPLQLSDALLNRSQDHSHFEMLIDRLKISSVPAENGNPDQKNSPSTGLEDITLENSDEAHEERGSDTQINSTLDIPETRETDQYEQRPVIERDSTFSVGCSQDISKIEEISESSKHMEDSNGRKEASPSLKNASSEPITKPPKSLFSYQVGSSKPKSLFGYQL